MTSGISGDAEDGGGNFRVTGGEGVYFFTLDMANGSFNAIRVQNMNLVGSFNGWNQADDAQQMTWDADNYSKLLYLIPLPQFLILLFLFQFSFWRK